MTDWIELVLGEDGEEAEDEERPALDGAAEVRRPALSRRDGAENETEPEAEPERLPEWKPGHRTQDAAPEVLDGTERTGVRLDRTDRAGVRLDRTDRAGTGLDRTDRAGTGLGRTDQAGTGLGRTDLAGVRTDGTDWAGARTDGTDWVKRAAEAGLDAAGSERTREAAGAGRELGGRLEIGTEPVGEGLPGRGPEPDSGSSAALMELYRGAAEGARAPAPALTPERGARTVLEREAGGAPGLTVEELDRAVRRDSRRYDGGMTIY